jgi:hypothetical protein
MKVDFECGAWKICYEIRKNRIHIEQRKKKKKRFNKYIVFVFFTSSFLCV